MALIRGTVSARIYPYDHARTPSHREIIVHASLSEDEGVVSESIGTWAQDKVYQSGAQGISILKDHAVRIAQVSVGVRSLIVDFRQLSAVILAPVPLRHR